MDISPDTPYSSYADASHSQSLGFIGGVGIDGGNGNATCIYSSCDDHDTWAPRRGMRALAIASASSRRSSSRIPSLLPSVGARRYGVAGTGWQGPGNGEESGDLWVAAEAAPSAASRALARAACTALLPWRELTIE